MAKRKSWIKKTFGNKFGISDVILILIIIGYPVYVAFKDGIEVLVENFAGYVWAGVLVGYIVNLLIRRAKR